ncbi:MAG: phosphatidylserine decarboxylase [Nitrospinota bacterium]|nr:MAG: phosphatidylserine decarboxylase [Nitrospinota bacterium]
MGGEETGIRIGRYGIASAALPFTLPTLCLSGFFFGVGWPWGGVALGGVTLFLLFFFRDPERQIPTGEGLVLAPADGRVLEVVREGAGWRISIFLSLFDVHINRSPVSGVVREVHYQPGKFLPAFWRNASTVNEQNTLIIDSPYGTIVVRQIVGILARRVVCWVHPGESITAGKRFGLMKFGSRIDLLLPERCELWVKTGARVRAGETVLAKFPKRPVVSANDSFSS